MTSTLLLADLVGEAAQYAARTLESVDAVCGEGSRRVLHPVEPLISCAHFVIQTLSMFGLKFPGAFNLNRMLTSPVVSHRQSQLGGDAATSDYSDIDISGGGSGVSSDAVDAVLEFRSSVRQSSMTGLKSLKQHKKRMAMGDSSSPFDPVKELDTQLQYLLKQCDEARTNLERSFGIKIEDIAGDKSSWRSVK